MAELDGFLTALALCHTVQVTEATENDLLPSYQASSPDEKALVEACSRLVRTGAGVVCSPQWVRAEVKTGVRVGQNGGESGSEQIIAGRSGSEWAI